MSTASEKANLARIRDNQRRSRARRKEYLQELEARLRQCELQGIEASAEIQIAARRVADENKKLRGLLAQHGVGDDSVEAYLQSSDPLMGGYGTTSGAVQVLESLLHTRKSVCTDSSIPIGSMRESRDSSASVSTVQSFWDPNHPPQNANSRQLSGVPQPPGRAASSAHQFMTPSSSASRTSSVLSGQSNGRPIHQHQRLAPVSFPRNSSPASNPSRGPHQMFEFDQQLIISNPSYNNTQLSTQHLLQPKSQPQRSSIYIPATGDTSIDSENMNSCGFATHMITTMAGGDPESIRAELGCLPDIDCDVDNNLVFNVMDRYTGTSVGL